MQRNRQTYDRAWSLIEAWAKGGMSVIAPPMIGHAIEVVDAFDEMVNEHLAEQKSAVDDALDRARREGEADRLAARDRPTAPALEAADGGIA